MSLSTVQDKHLLHVSHLKNRTCFIKQHEYHNINEEGYYEREKSEKRKGPASSSTKWSTCNSSPNYTTGNVPQNGVDCDDEPEALNSNLAERMSNDATPSLLAYLPISNEQTDIPKLKKIFKFSRLTMKRVRDALRKS